MLRKISATTLVLMMATAPSFTQLVINEWSASNMSVTTDNFGEYEDWVELYNTGSSAVNLAGYHLSDKPANLIKWIFPSSSGTIAAGGYQVVWLSGRDSYSGGSYHTNFKITQCIPEWLILSDPSGVVVDSFKLKPAQVDHSRGRTTDGAATWSVFTNPTPGAANTNAQQEYVAKPVFSLAPGFYAAAQNLTITSPDPNTEIRYTTDGSTPTQSSTLYSGPLSIGATEVVRARCFSTSGGIPASFIETNSYFIGVTHVIPVVSVCGDQIMTLLNGSWGAQPEISIEYFERDGTFIDEAEGEANKHGNDSWAYDQRGFDYVTKDQFGYNYAIRHKIFNLCPRKKFQRLIFKPAANDNYNFEDGAHIRDAYVHVLSYVGPTKLALDERRYEPCVMYVNGQYWGVYETREKADDSDYTKYYSNQKVPYKDSPVYVQYIKTWGSTWTEYGGSQALTDWNSIKNFILSNNMADPNNFAYVDSIYNWKSLIDYFVLNSYTVCKDWLVWNTAWWRGLNQAGDKLRWRYTLWDMDATFGHYVNYTGIPDITANADPCNPENLGDPGNQGHVPILNALMDNPTFKQYYISRFIDLSNTTFSCQNMQYVLDSLIAQIAPEMTDQINRWNQGGQSYAGWQNNVQTMKQFIDDRCAALAQGLNNCYSVVGPYDIAFDVSPVNSGTVKVNSLLVNNFLYSGQYYGNIDVLLKANANTGWQFDHWTTLNHADSILDISSGAPNLNAANVKLRAFTTDTIVAVFVPAGSPPPPPPVDTTDTVEPPSVPITDLFVPNAFSPNGDNKNDILYVNGNHIAIFKFTIYNRWGEVVFETTDQHTGWDGTYKGGLLNSGVYAYKLDLVYDDGRREKTGGNITLMR